VNEISLPIGSEKRAAALAVSRYGADRAQVDRLLQEVLQQRARGKAADLLQVLVSENVLSSSQAHEMQQELAAVPTLATPPTTNAPTALPDPNTPLPDDVVGAPSASGRFLKSIGNYRLLRRLGQGGMGSVYLGYEEGQNRQVAIKVLSDQLASNAAYVERFYREAKSGGQLDHPNIVRFLSAGHDQATGKHYLVMEYVDGDSAHSLLDRSGRLAVGDAVHLALDIARGLEHAHSRNIVHRDIKPDNILITKSGMAKLADLGLAKRLDEVSNLTALRVGFGTVDYIPYEQSLNAKQADARSDIFALGATLYHLLTGRVPFPGNSYFEVAERKQRGVFTPASAIHPDIPASLDRILAKMLARKPSDRYQMVSELIVDLDRSNLAAPLPSFADLDLVWKDPQVRARLASPAPPTQLDVQTQPGPANPPSKNGDPDTWVLRFRNREGHLTKKKMSTQQIVDGLTDGRLRPHIDASRQPRGDFRPLDSYPEFREVGSKRRDHSAPVAPSHTDQARTIRRWSWIGTGVAVAIAALAMAVWLILRS
jgi:serine/threonine-protein kinase